MTTKFFSFLNGNSPPAADSAEEVINGLYKGLLGREPDPTGMAHWKSVWSTTPDIAVIAAGIVGSEEFRRRDVEEIHRQRQAKPLIEAVAPLLRDLLSDNPATIVDIGAQNLQDEDHVYTDISRYEIPHRVVGFEPLEHRRLERMAQISDGSLTLLPAFIGDGQAHTFHINAPDATSSLLPFNTETTRRFNDLASLETVSIESANTVTLDSALEGTPDIDLIKLDIQGFELTALLHAAASLQRTLVVHCEVSFMEIYHRQALFSEVELFLRAAGFELVDLQSPCRYSLADSRFSDSRDCLGWADAVFFRRLAANAPWRHLLGQSLVALLVYKKPSLAMAIANNLQNTPAENYLNALQKVALA